MLKSVSFLFRDDARAVWTGLGLIFYVVMLVWSAVPGQHEKLAGSANDKILHFGAYAFIAAALYLGQGSAPRRAMRVIVLVAVLGGIDELLQLPQPHRTSDISDWGIDVSAAVVVAAAGRLRRRTVR